MSEELEYTKEFDEMERFEKWLTVVSLVGTEISDADNRKKLFDHPSVITMQINGISVSPKNVIDRLAQAENNIKEHSKKLAMQFANDMLLRFVSKMEDSIESAINSAWEEFSNKELTGE